MSFEVKWPWNARYHRDNRIEVINIARQQFKDVLDKSDRYIIKCRLLYMETTAFKSSDSETEYRMKFFQEARQYAEEFFHTISESPTLLVEPRASTTSPIERQGETALQTTPSTQHTRHATGTFVSPSIHGLDATPLQCTLVDMSNNQKGVSNRRSQCARTPGLSSKHQGSIRKKSTGSAMDNKIVSRQEKGLNERRSHYMGPVSHQTSYAASSVPVFPLMPLVSMGGATIPLIQEEENSFTSVARKQAAVVACDNPNVSPIRNAMPFLDESPLSARFRPLFSHAIQEDARAPQHFSMDLPFLSGTPLSPRHHRHFSHATLPINRAQQVQEIVSGCGSVPTGTTIADIASIGTGLPLLMLTPPIGPLHKSGFFTRDIRIHNHDSTDPQTVIGNSLGCLQKTKVPEISDTLEMALDQGSHLSPHTTLIDAQIPGIDGDTSVTSPNHGHHLVAPHVMLDEEVEHVRQDSIGVVKGKEASGVEVDELLHLLQSSEGVKAMNHLETIEVPAEVPNSVTLDTSFSIGLHDTENAVLQYRSALVPVKENASRIIEGVSGIFSGENSIDVVEPFTIGMERAYALDGNLNGIEDIQESQEGKEGTLENWKDTSWPLVYPSHPAIEIDGDLNPFRIGDAVASELNCLPRHVPPQGISHNTAVMCLPYHGLHPPSIGTDRLPAPLVVGEGVQSGPSVNTSHSAITIDRDPNPFFINDAGANGMNCLPIQIPPQGLTQNTAAEPLPYNDLHPPSIGTNSPPVPLVRADGVDAGGSDLVGHAVSHRVVPASEVVSLIGKDLLCPDIGIDIEPLPPVPDHDVQADLNCPHEQANMSLMPQKAREENSIDYLGPGVAKNGTVAGLDPRDSHNELLIFDETFDKLP